ncbi:MAG TPA: hypothetical protein VII92_20615 [Anaerolineae bacterium]
MPITISDEQVQIHKTTEALSVWLIAPFVFFLAWKGGTISDRAKLGLIVIGIMILLVDGGLLLRWKKLEAK